MALLKVSGISKIEGNKFVVKDIYFTQEPFEKIAIAGETGSGKTSLLKMIAGLSQPTSGQILFNDKNVKGPNEQLIAGNKNIAYLSQHFELRNHYRVYEILQMANELTATEAASIYAICRITHLLQRSTDELSGGEKQRIALARLLSTSPKLLLLDEPFSNLDMLHKSLMKSVLQDLGEKLQISFILVSHDALDILSWADRIMLMKAGQIVQQGSAEQVYRQPINEYCAGLLGAYNLVNANADAAFTASLPASVMNGKKLLIRPEHICISAQNLQGLRGTIQKILYWGSYYTIDVQVGKQLIRAQTRANKFKEGEEITLEISVENTWYL